MSDKKFFDDEAAEIMRGQTAKISARHLTVGAVRKIFKEADRLNITSIEVTDTGHSLPFRISLRQLRPVVENVLKLAHDNDVIDLGIPPTARDRVH